MKKTIIFLTLLVTYGIFSQKISPHEYGLKQFCIKNKKLGKINFYVTKNGIGKEKPLLILLDGSGNLPIYSLLKKDNGSSTIISTIPFNYRKLSEKFHVVLISKPGTPFLDSLLVNSFEQFAEKYKPSKEYNEKLSLEWRVNSADKVIKYLLKKLKIKNKKVVVIGYSEGGQVVPKLATKNKKITKIVSIVGGGLNQFYDFIIAERLKAEKGIITTEQAQNNIDSLYLKLKEIYDNPDATDKFWLGHTYKRWNSFSKDIPLENMLKLDIPILIIASGKDKNSPILGLDYTKLEFTRKGKKNLTYKVYPNCDHWFNNQKNKTNKMDMMIEYVIKWIEKKSN